MGSCWAQYLVYWAEVQTGDELLVCLHSANTLYSLINSTDRPEQKRVNPDQKMINIFVLKKSSPKAMKAVAVWQDIAPDKRVYPHIIFLISVWKHMVWVLIRSNPQVLLMSSHNICFWTEIRIILELFGWKNHTMCFERISWVEFQPLTFINRNTIEASTNLFSHTDKQNVSINSLNIRHRHLGPVVQSIVSLMSSLVVRMLTVLVSKISNSQVFWLKKCE